MHFTRPFILLDYKSMNMAEISLQAVLVKNNEAKTQPKRGSIVFPEDGCTRSSSRVEPRCENISSDHQYSTPAFVLIFI
jgi:hypothetical protein